MGHEQQNVLSKNRSGFLFSFPLPDRQLIGALSVLWCPVIWAEVLYNWDSFGGVVQFSAHIESKPPSTPFQSIKCMPAQKISQCIKMTQSYTYSGMQGHTTHIQIHAHMHRNAQVFSSNQWPECTREVRLSKAGSIFHHLRTQFSHIFDTRGILPCWENSWST